MDGRTDGLIDFREGLFCEESLDRMISVVFFLQFFRAVFSELYGPLWSAHLIFPQVISLPPPFALENQLRRQSQTAFYLLAQ